MFFNEELAHRRLARPYNTILEESGSTLYGTQRLPTSGARVRNLVLRVRARPTPLIVLDTLGRFVVISLRNAAMAGGRSYVSIDAKT